jgi:hypothetical protein
LRTNIDNLTAEQISYFRAFGFIVLRGLITDVDLLRREAEATIRDATGALFRTNIKGGGIEGHYIPATNEKTPCSLDLAISVATIVESLLSRQAFLVHAQHILYFGEAAFHNDTIWQDQKSVHAVAYLDELTADNGALRVLPGTHRGDQSDLGKYAAVPDGTPDEVFERLSGNVPCYVIDSSPGDLIIFDERLYHASLGGRDRYQWSGVYFADPENVKEEEMTRGAIAGCYLGEPNSDYYATAYPYYSDYFRQQVPARWVQNLEKHGAFEDAAEEPRR